MRELSLERTQLIPQSLGETFAFFADARNLEAITPPWLRFRILEAPATLERGSLLRYRLRLFGVPISWRTEITHWRAPRSFTDTQLSGPYRLWVHTHRFRMVAGGTEMHDHVAYRLRGGLLAPLANRLFVRPWLEAIFDYRAARLRELLSPGG